MSRDVEEPTQNPSSRWIVRIYNHVDGAADFVGINDGKFDGSTVADFVGAADGWVVCPGVGTIDGNDDGSIDGMKQRSTPNRDLVFSSWYSCLMRSLMISYILDFLLFSSSICDIG